MDRKPIFDGVRVMLGRSFTTAEVSALDAAIDKALGLIGSQQRTTSSEGVALIKDFEGLRLKAYPDPGTGGDPWTIGIGTTVYPDGRKVKPGDVITEAQAEDYLRHDLTRFEAAVNRLTGGVTTQGQFDALVSFTYNLGDGALKTSTLLRKHNEGDYAGAQAEFSKWVLAGGQKLTGLVRRRAAEAALYGRAP